jgi:hypothetical protein
MTRIVFTRHGHVEGISRERFRRRADVALTNSAGPKRRWPRAYRRVPHYLAGLAPSDLDPIQDQRDGPMIDGVGPVQAPKPAWCYASINGCSS